MRNRNPEASLRLVIPMLLILPPIGLYLLWRSARSTKFKAWVSVITVVFVFGISAAVVMNNNQGQVPSSGYDVSIDSRGNYRDPHIRDFERQVFTSVVRLKRADQTGGGTTRVGEDAGDPDGWAFRQVALQYGLDESAVRDIYMKVSVLVSAGTSRK